MQDGNKRHSYPTGWQEVSSLTSEDARGKETPSNGLLEMRHPITSLHPATDYEAIVMVENKFGWSEESEIFRFNTRKGE